MKMKRIVRPRIVYAGPAIYSWLQIAGLVLLVAGFAGPWIYGPLGKSKDFGWQPVWGLLLSFISLNVFILLSVAGCISYLEMYYRSGKPVLEGVLKWVGSFLLLVIGVPLATWLIIDQTQRGTTAQFTEGTLGWGVWLALAGLVIQVVAIRLKIQVIKKQSGESKR